MSSTISAARQALYTLLAASPPASTNNPAQTVQVTFGDPLAYEDQEVICLRGITVPAEHLAVTGDTRHDEEFGIELTVKAHNPAGDPATTDARGFALTEYVRGIVGGNKQLSLTPSTPGTGTVAWSWFSSQRTAGVQPAEGGGWVIFVDVTVSCRSLPAT